MIRFGMKQEDVNYRYARMVFGVCFKDQHFLLVRNDKGEYFLPGGEMEVNEQEAQCLLREFEIETGYKAFLSKCIGRAEHHYDQDGENIQQEASFYEVSLKRRNKIAAGYDLTWMTKEMARERLLLEHHKWAIEQVNHF
ncbi:NUDIX domain-containing protein [Jeotgalibacillus sp. R-1-5s-1]|uniref:NUDIX domain-containing protein n=1 Tax=Jeotgalibacillus sp. R-1-5s-1 TaxID=2555897 RepID=UPI00141B8576|nr:NUDIX domain-containing protein [Jeotgalibacillus sp. R-1-5s-1]